MERYHLLLIGRNNIVKMAILPNAIYRFNAIPIKMPMKFFTELEQTILNSYGTTRTLNCQNNLKKKRTKLEVSPSQISDYTTKLWKSKQHSTGTKRLIDQWNRRESPETNPHTYSQLIYDKGGKNIQWKKTVSSISGAGKTG